jgi:regulator of sirC expression with transglutaminase-like and TPR domain
LTIDKMIDSSIDVEGSVKKLDAMAAGIRAMPEFGASSATKLEALRRYVYVSGTWNGHQPFEYDLDDPLGANIKNKLLPTYLASRKGNCVSMPLLFVILGQRLGIEVAVSLVPKHVFVKYRDELGTWINLEATSGANPARDVWVREQSPFTDEALANGLYMQPLTKKETIAVMAGTLSEYWLRHGDHEKAIALSDLTLAYYPKDVAAMLQKATGYGRIARAQFEEKYPSPKQIPADERGYFEYLIHQHRSWVAKAEKLGWREETKEDMDKYLWSVKQARARGGAN